MTTPARRAPSVADVASLVVRYQWDSSNSDEEAGQIATDIIALFADANPVGQRVLRLQGDTPTITLVDGQIEVVMLKKGDDVVLATSLPTPADVTLRHALVELWDYHCSGVCDDERHAVISKLVNVALARQPKVLVDDVVSVRIANEIARVHPAFRDLQHKMSHLNLDDKVHVIVVKHGD